MYRLESKYHRLSTLWEYTAHSDELSFWLELLEYYDPYHGAENELNYLYAYFKSDAEDLEYTYHNYVRLLVALEEYILYFIGTYKENLNKEILEYLQAILLDIEELQYQL